MPVSGHPHILHVDDEETAVRAIHHMLCRLGYRVESFTHPLEALAAFQRDPRRFDLVLSDVALPELSGPALARQILALRADIPVILISGYANERTQPEIASCGARELVEKPVDLATLSAALRRALA